MRCATSAPTPTASPSRTPGSSRSPMATWPSAGAIPRTGNKKRLMTLDVEEFLRRFLLHVLPPGFVRIRNFGFLANRNRAYAVAPVLPTARQFREDDCFGAIHGPTNRLIHSGTVQSAVEPCTALRGSTPASLTTATRPVRCMNRNQQPRPLPVLWRACRSLVSTGQDWSATDPSSYRTTPPCDASNLTSYIKAADRTHYSEFMHSQNTSGSFKVHRLPVGGFLQVAVSEAPSQSACETRTVARGRSRYSTRTFEE